jgi:endonuclease YncB( thermonuclease family)
MIMKLAFAVLAVGSVGTGVVLVGGSSEAPADPTVVRVIDGDTVDARFG